MIRLLSGPDLGVARIPEALVVEWVEGDCRVVCAYAKQGLGLAAHFAAEKKSLRRLKDAINDWCEWAMWAYPWCECIFAVIGIPSVERIVKKCGFRALAEVDRYRVYIRGRVEV